MIAELQRINAKLRWGADGPEEVVSCGAVA